MIYNENKIQKLKIQQTFAFRGHFNNLAEASAKLLENILFLHNTTTVTMIVCFSYQARTYRLYHIQGHKCIRRPVDITLISVMLSFVVLHQTSSIELQVCTKVNLICLEFHEYLVQNNSKKCCDIIPLKMNIYRY